MKRSTDRILTTHCGSLPRPKDLLDMMKAKINGEPYDPETYARRVRSAVAESVRWLVADITHVSLKPHAYDVWHDRAVFHFLTASQDRLAYVHQVARAVKPGGHVIVSTFGPEGPTKCSGLDVVRYDAESLHREFGAHFRVLESSKELHKTPFGRIQQFLYCHCKLE